jgi:alanine dehydrogenase
MMKGYSPSQAVITLTKEGLLPQEEKLEIAKKQKSFSIGIPKETFKDEGRVSITPLAVELLTNSGHSVYIQTQAGKDGNFQDIHYSECGGIIVQDAKEVYQCDIILKVAPFSVDEIRQLRGNQTIFTSIHITVQTEEYFRLLVEKRITAIAFEYLKDENNCFPIVRSMSEIAGSTSVLIAAEYLSNQHGGKGEMLGGITGVNPSEVVILGAGTAGEYAARTAMGLGAVVKIFDYSIFRLRRLQNNLGQRIFTSTIHPKVLANSLKSADVVIGAMRMDAHKNQFIVTEDMVQKMKNGSVIIDISIDQGGCVETSELTSHSNPVFRKHGVIHYCVPNTASRVARTASYALSNIFAPILLSCGDAGGVQQLLKENQGMRSGVYVYQGIITKEQIGTTFGISWKDIDLLMAAF